MIHGLATDLDQLTHALERALTQGIKPKKQCYPYIPFSNGQFVRIVDEAMAIYKNIADRKSHQRPRFLDAGCGIGSKVRLAASRGFHSDGVEILKKYCDIARKVCDRVCDSSSIIHSDLREFNGFGNYDVIYTYSPMLSSASNKAWQMRMAEQAKERALFLNCTAMPTLPYIHQIEYYIAIKLSEPDQKLIDRIKKLLHETQAP